MQALEIVEQAYPDADGPASAKQFYEQVERLFGGAFDTQLGRDTFRTGVAFMRWAEEIGEALPD